MPDEYDFSELRNYLSGQIDLLAHGERWNGFTLFHQGEAHAVTTESGIACHGRVQEQCVGTALFELFGSMFFEVVRLEREADDDLTAGITRSVCSAGGAGRGAVAQYVRVRHEFQHELATAVLDFFVAAWAGR